MSGKPVPPDPTSLRSALQWIAALTAVPVTTLEEARFVIEEVASEADAALATGEVWQRQQEQ